MASSTFLPGDLSPFRAGFLKVAFLINAVWVDVPTTELGEDGVSIKRGASNERGISEPGAASFSLKDPIGKWNPRNPASTYYGSLGRGTPVRVQVEFVSGIVWDRFYGEVTTMVPRWTKKGAVSARVDVEVAGALRRLGQGSSPLRSPLYRACSTLGANLIAYWPMEDGANSGGFSAAVGGRRATVKGSPNFATYAGILGSQPLPTLESGQVLASVPPYTNLATAQAQVRWTGMTPAATPNNSIVMRLLFGGGTLDYVDMTYSTGGGIKVEGFSSGASVGSNLYAMNVDNRKLRYSLEFTQSGANIAWTFGTLEAGAPGGGFGTGTFTGVTLGTLKLVWVNSNVSALAGMAFGHLTVERAVTSLFAVASSVLTGYLGETADARVARLCAENGVSSVVSFGAGLSSRKMGVQGTKDLLSLLRECEATDGGLLYEPAVATDVGYLVGERFFSRTPLTFAYVENMFSPFEPVEDDQNLRNLITVTRDGGGSTTRTEPNGALGTTRVGIYDEQVTLSLPSDDATTDQAGWLLHLGTTDEPRWRQIGVDLADPRIKAGVRDQILIATLGSRIDITGVPAWLPPFTVSQLVVGYTEKITPTSYKIVWNCAPARPYRVAYWTSGGRDRYSGDGTTIAAPGITTTTQTTFTATPPAGVTWTTTDLPFDIVPNGEQMTVTAITAISGGTQTFTVTRGVNGVRKTHPAGSAVVLADPCYYGL